MDMQRDKDMADILACAIKAEEDAVSFYEKLEQIAKRESVKGKCRDLAHDERGHRDILLKISSKLIGEGQGLPSVSPERKTAEEGFPVALNDLRSLMLFAIAREEEAERFYVEAADKTDDEEIKNVLLQLASIEKGHAILLEEELKHIR